MKILSTLVLTGVGFIALSYYALPQITPVEYASVENNDHVDTEEMAPQVVPETIDTRPVVTHVPLPKEVKSIYMTSCVLGTTDFRNRLVSLIEETEINAVVIDIKDFSGTISFPPSNDAWKQAWQAAKCGSADTASFIAELHKKGIFVIGRITVFQDPFYTTVRPDLAVARASDGGVWKDGKGLSFIDVGSRDYWDHIIALSVDAYNIGFDELNFDYVRYPSDGNMEDIAFPNSAKSEYGTDKQANLEAFFKYLNEKLDDESRFASVRHVHTGRASSTPWTSADLFGMTTTSYNDLAIGQVIERAVPYFDFIAPMVYPSHYPRNFNGFANPNDYPYEVVKYTMGGAVSRIVATTTRMNGFMHERMGTSTPALYLKPSYPATKLRTWIQDFDYGGDYDAADVRAQIRASYDAGVDSWMLWAPSNIYTKEALEVQLSPD